MSRAVERIAREVKSLPPAELDEFLNWLSDFTTGQMDEWDSEVARDSKPGGRLEPLLRRAEQDVATGRTKPLDEVLDDK